LRIREKKLPNDWLTFNAKSLLGGVLFARNKNPETESLLLAGYAGLKQREALIPHAGHLRREEAIKRLVRFYQAAGQAGKVVEWQRTLTETTSERYRKTADQLRQAAEDGEPASLNRAAWFLATCPEPGPRDGGSAVALAEKAVAKTDRKDAASLATLAAAYAETGQFEKAIPTQKEAIACASEPKGKADLGNRLVLYENKTPYRDYESLGFGFIDQVMFLDAEESYRQGLAYLQRSCASTPAVWSEYGGRLAQVLKMEHKYAEAKALTNGQADPAR